MKKFISLLVAFAITLNFICVQVAAEDENYSGDSASGTYKWSFDPASGTLQFDIYGNGLWVDSFSSPDEVPWAPFRELITNVYTGTNNIWEIGSYAFYGCTQLTQIPFLGYTANTIKIGDHAFEDCSGFTDLDIYQDVELGNYVFKGCDNLSSVRLGDGVRDMGIGVFKDCTALTSADIDSSFITEVGDGTFEGCTSLADVDIPSGTASIGIEAFKDCKNLPSVDLPRSLGSIGTGAFSGCESLDGVRVPDSVTEMGTNVFENCSSLAELVLPAGITEIGDSMFYGDAALASIEIPEGVTKIGDFAFYGCASLTEAKLPAGVTEIGNSAFYACTGITEMILPASVLTVGDFAFNGCSNLKAVFVPEGAAIEGSNMVSMETTYHVTYKDTADGVEIVSIAGGTSAADKVNIPSEINGKPVTAVDSAYHGLVSQDHSHVIVGGVCTICGQSGGESGTASWSITEDGTLVISPIGADGGRMADYTDTALPDWYSRKDEIKKLQIRSGVTYLGNYAFKDLNIEEIIIPSGVMTMGNNVFNGVQTANTTVWIPESVNSVGEKLFEGSNITMVLYPSSLEAAHGLPENAVKAKYVDDGDVIRITEVDDKGYTGTTYTFPPADLQGKPVIPGTHNHNFDSEYGSCTICGITGGNIGKADSKDAYWYWSDENSTLFVLAKEGVTSPAIKDFTAPVVVSPPSETEGSNPWVRLLKETGKDVLNLSISGKITEIGDYAFQGLTKITKATIPQAAKIIGDHAFEDCRLLEEVTFPDGVTEIGESAFKNCNKIYGIQLPESVTTIGKDAFMGCSQLNQIAYPSGASASVADSGATIPGETFKLEYRAYASDPDNKVEITKILPGIGNTFVTVPEYICGKEVVFVEESSRELVNKNTCPHKFIDPNTNICLICGNIQGDASEDLDGAVEWKFENGVLTIWGSGRMQDFTNTKNPPWEAHLPNIYEIVIADGVRSIGAYAFDGAQNLTSVSIPNSVTEIGGHAFAHCIGLKEITIPHTVAKLGSDVFEGYSDILKVTMPHSLYSAYKDILFTTGGTNAVVLFYDGTQIVGASIEGTYNGPRVLMPSGFELSDTHEHCFKLSDRTCILCGTIGGFCGTPEQRPYAEWAFDTLNGELKISGEGAVTSTPWIDLYKNQIRRVEIGDEITSLCDNAFKDCANLSYVTIGNYSKMESIGASAFSGCTKLTDILLPPNLRTLGSKAFENTGLSGMIVLPNNVASVAADSFAGCGGITALAAHNNLAVSTDPSQWELPNETAAILAYDGNVIKGIYVPNGHENVTVNIPSQILEWKITDISNSQESTNGDSHSKIIGVVLPDSITAINDNAFSGFTNLSQLNIPSGVQYIGRAAFSHTALVSVNIPDGITEIPYEAFLDCPNLKNVRLPEGLQAIRSSAFESCNQLEELTIPESVTLIGDLVFAGCTSLGKLVIPFGVQEILSNSFAGCSGLEVLEIPKHCFNDALEQTLAPNLTTVIVYDRMSRDESNEFAEYYPDPNGVPVITGAVLGKEERWDNDNLVRYPVWSGHEDCFNSKRRCVLCGRQGGMCGNSATWIYKDNEYTIVITGTGEMWDMIEGDNHYDEMWYTLKDRVQRVEINSGLESIGANAFADCTDLNTVIVPDTVRTIGRNAFGSSEKLDTVSIGTSSALTEIGEEAFINCTALENISLPQSLETVGSKAFKDCTGLKSITIPNLVSFIGSEAFKGCTRLSAAKLPISLTTFGNEAFAYCTSLTEIVVPVGVTGGTAIFKECRNIKYAVIPQSFNVENFNNEDPADQSPRTVIKYNADNSIARITEAKTTLTNETIVIPSEIMNNTVREISRNAFSYNSTYNGESANVQLPDTLTTIDDYAFKGCTWLKEINIPDVNEVSSGVTHIGRQAFEGCTTLTEVVIPDSVEYLGKEAFQMCTNLESVTLSDSVTVLRESLFNGCAKLDHVIVPDSVKEIEEKVFEDCVRLKYVVLPFGMRIDSTINFTAFDGCTELAALFAPTADGDIDDETDDAEAIVTEREARQNKLRIAVYNNNKEVFKVTDGTTTDPRSSLEEVLEMPEGFTLRLDPPHVECFNIHNQCILCGDMGGWCGEDAQWKLDSAGTLTVWGTGEIDHDNAKYYGTWDNFRSRIMRLEIGEGITVIDDNAFKSCRLISAQLPSTLEEIGDHAFSDCIALTEISIPNSVISIGVGAFEGDLTLRSAELPNSISRLNSDTFKGCISLGTVKLPEDLRYVETGVFSGCTALTTIELPLNTTRVSEEAFKDCVNLTYIVAPDRCNYTFDGDEFVNATYFKYRLKGSGVEITYARPGKNIHHLVVPREIAGYPVVAIGDNAFSPEYSSYARALSDDGEDGLVSVVLPDTVTAIGKEAYKDNVQLQRIVFEGRVTTIGDSAFENCVALVEAALPDSVVSIGNRAFYNCVSLRTIPLYEGLETIGSQAFEGCSFDRSVIIVPSTVREMGENAFGSVANTAVIAISEGLAENYDYSGDNCGYLVYRVMSDGVKSVMKAKLGDGMTTITVPNVMNVHPNHEHCWVNGPNSLCALCNFAGGSCGGDETVDGNNAFWRIDRNTGTLYIEGSGELRDYLGDETAPWLAPELRDTIRAIVIEDGITSVSANAFLHCENVKTASIPDSVSEIGENAFLGCTSLTEISIPEGVTEIKENTFNGCSALKNADLPDSVGYIASGAFVGCGSLSCIELGDNDVLIADDAFSGTLDYIAAGNNAKINLGNYNIFRYVPVENGVKIVKAQLGGNRSELKFPAAVDGKPVVAVGGNVVDGYTAGIKQITLQEGIGEIEGGAFKGCTDLTYLTLPKSLKTIGSGAFSECTSLTSLNLNNGLETIGANAFSGCDSLIKVKLPHTVTEAGNGAFSDCGRLETIYASEKTVINRNYFPETTLVRYNDQEHIIRASLGSGRSTIDKNGMEVDPDHEHCWYQGVCLLCNDSGGLCGSGLLWSLNDGVLVIERREGLGATDSDTGEMYDFGSANPTPWGDRAGEITKLIIREGTASIGANAFRDCPNLTDISEAFPSTVTRIGENAFRNCIGLSGELTLAENITEVGANAFAECPGLTKLTLSDKTAPLNVSSNTAVIKYHTEGENAVITEIAPAEGRKTDIPDAILGHKVVKVEKAYRKYVSDKHTHYHTAEDGNRCTLCDRISGECGPNTSWYIDEENGRLIIDGSGIMYDYDDADAPWTQYAEMIDSIVIREGVTSIGSNAFVNCGSFDEITLPQSIVSIGDNAFAGCTVRRMYIPSHISQADRDKLSPDIEKVFYTVGNYENGGQYADITRIDLPEGVETIVIPKTINCIPVRQVYADFRKFVSQEGHEHIYSGSDTDECHSSECLICGKVTYIHVWEDGWSSDENGHWHDCERGDYSPVRDGDLDGSGYGDHDWTEVDRKDPTRTEEGWVLYRCDVCGREKREVLEKLSSGGPTSPGSGDDTGTGSKPPVVTGSGSGGGGGYVSPSPTPGGGSTTTPPTTSGGTADTPSTGSGGASTASPYTQPWENTQTAPPVTNPPSGNRLPNESNFGGTYNLSMEQANNALNASVANNTDQILSSVLTQEELDRLVNGTSNVQIILSVTEGDGTVSLKDRAIISAALGEYKLGEYLDISLYKVIDGVRERITHTSSPITITVDIPSSLRNGGRRFRMIRAHDGAAAVLRDMDNNSNTITISTDRFSPYAIAYTDSVHVSEDYDPPMNTGDTGISAFVLVTMASGLTAVGMIYFNHASDVVVEQERRRKIARLVAFGKKGRLQKYLAIPLIFIVTLYYQGIEGIQKNKKDTAED
ncbi:MAG: leucine-rich repeat domain-containing protein [Bacteroides sp.]|nr:leucine-rich repeat domain-containing protein [Bacteroides sp.]